MFWNAQLLARDALVAASSPVDDKWGNVTPHVMLPSSGMIKLAALMSLALQCELWGFRSDPTIPFRIWTHR